MIVNELEIKLLRERDESPSALPITLNKFSIELANIIIFLNRSIMRGISNDVYIRRVAEGYYSPRTIVYLKKEIKCPEIFNQNINDEIKTDVEKYLQKYSENFIVMFIYKTLTIDSCKIFMDNFKNVIYNIKYKNFKTKHDFELKMKMSLQKLLKFDYGMNISIDIFNSVNYIRPAEFLGIMNTYFGLYRKLMGTISSHIIPEFKIKNILVNNIPENCMYDISQYTEGIQVYSDRMYTYENMYTFYKYYARDGPILIGIKNFHKNMKNGKIDTNKFSEQIQYEISLINVPPVKYVYDKDVIDIFTPNETIDFIESSKSNNLIKAETFMSINSNKNMEISEPLLEFIDREAASTKGSDLDLGEAASVKDDESALLMAKNAYRYILYKGPNAQIGVKDSLEKTPLQLFEDSVHYQNPVTNSYKNLINTIKDELRDTSTSTALHEGGMGGGGLNSIDFVEAGRSVDVGEAASVGGDREAASTFGSDLDVGEAAFVGGVSPQGSAVGDLFEAASVGGDRDAASIFDGDRDAASIFDSDLVETAAKGDKKDAFDVVETGRRAVEGCDSPRSAAGDLDSPKDASVKKLSFPYSKSRNNLQIKYKKLKNNNLLKKCNNCKKESLNTIKSFIFKDKTPKTLNCCKIKCMKNYKDWN